MITNKGFMEDSILKKMFSNRYMGFVGTLFGLIGIILSIYFYFQSRESRNLVYTISSSRALVVDSQKASRLQVLYLDRIIYSDIVAIQLAIWNEGKQSIKKANILENIKIKASDSVQILETSVRKVSRKVTKFSILKNINNNIPLTWDILENNDGAVVQVLYAGKLDAKFFIDGVIEGQSAIRKITIDDSKDQPSPIFLIIFGSVFLFFGYFVLFKSRSFGHLFDTARPINQKLILGKNMMIALLLGMPISFIIVGIYSLIVEPPTVPFSF